MDIGRFFIFALAFGTAFAAEWSTCSKLCGGGTKTRTRACFFGPFCTQQESVYCNTQPCAPKTFNTYTPCSKSCGGGHRFKVEPCIKNNVDLCKKTYEECNSHACQPLQSCPYKQKYRYQDKSRCCKESTESCGVLKKSLGGSLVRIFGGETSEPGEWPWMAVIVIKNSKTTHCTGSLIHKDYVLTAAHCADPAIYHKDKYYVLLGSTRIKFPEVTKQIIAIAEFIPHEQHSNPIHDIGLVKLKSSAQFDDFVKPICLPNGEKIKLDTTCVAAGWGIANKADLNVGKTSDKLQHVTLRNLPEDACVEGLKDITWKTKFFSNVDNLCFGILSGDKDTCRGDSGGPIMCQRCTSCGWYVAGVTAYGPNNCGTKGQPSVYMYVRSYEYWIRSKIPGMSKKSSFSC